jgi:hypothetical protein
MAREAVYVELDCLLDTRLGTVVRLDELAAVKLINDERYYAREHDDFSVIIPGFDDQAFRELYKNRDEETLVQSRPTNMLAALYGMMEKLVLDSINTPLIDKVEIDVNLYPYKLDKETVDDIKIMIMTYLPFQVRVNAVYLPPAHLTPAHIKETYGLIILYNLSEWFEFNLAGLQSSVRIPAVTMMAPALYLGKDHVPTKDQLLDEKDVKADGFVAIEVIMVEYVGLAMQPPIAYSLLRPDRFNDAKDKIKNTETGE